MPEKHIRPGAVHRAAPWIFAVAAAVMPFAASAQTPFAGSAQSGVATAPAPKQVGLNAVPPIGAQETAAPRQVPRPQNGLSDREYKALKDATGRRRFDMRNIQPLPPPADPTGGSTSGAQ